MTRTSFPRHKIRIALLENIGFGECVRVELAEDRFHGLGSVQAAHMAAVDVDR